MTEHTGARLPIVGSLAASADTPQDPDVRLFDRAVDGHAIGFDSFSPEQEAASRVAELDPEAFAEWFQNLSSSEGARALERLDALADEHRRRAVALNGIADTIRSKYAQLSRYMTDETATQATGR